MPDIIKVRMRENFHYWKFRVLIAFAVGFAIEYFIGL